MGHPWSRHGERAKTPHTSSNSIFLASGFHPGDAEAANLPCVNGLRLGAPLLGPPFQRAFNIELIADKSTLPSAAGVSAAGLSVPARYTPSMPSPNSTLANPCHNIENSASNHAAHRVLSKIFVHSDRGPLFHAQAHLTLCLVHLEHLGLDHLAHPEHVLRVMNVLFGADLADVNHALNSVRKLNEGAEFGEAGNRSLDGRTHRKLLLYLRPGIAQRLFQAQGEAALAHVHSENHRFHRVALS